MNFTVREEIITITEESYYKSLRDVLLCMRDEKSRSEVLPRNAIIIVPVPSKGKCELSQYEGTLRERCKMRKRTSRRRREFEAARARQELS